MNQIKKMQAVRESVKLLNLFKKFDVDKEKILNIVSLCHRKDTVTFDNLYNFVKDLKITKFKHVKTLSYYQKEVYGVEFKIDYVVRKEKIVKKKSTFKETKGSTIIEIRCTPEVEPCIHNKSGKYRPTIIALAGLVNETN